MSAATFGHKRQDNAAHYPRCFRPEGDGTIAAVKSRRMRETQENVRTDESSGDMIWELPR